MSWKQRWMLYKVTWMQDDIECSVIIPFKRELLANKNAFVRMKKVRERLQSKHYRTSFKNTRILRIEQVDAAQEDLVLA